MMNTEYIPRFRVAFLHPRYWLIWCGTGLICLMAFIPSDLRDPVLGWLGRLAGRLSRRARRRAEVNLTLCFPWYSRAQREQITDDMFSTVPVTTVLMAELALRGAAALRDRTHIVGADIVDRLRSENKNVIFLVPHSWGADIPAMLMAAQGIPVAAMFHNQRNPVLDYVWNSARRRFGGRLHARRDGIRPFIRSVREGYMGYYLPDQDPGPEKGVFADFFSTRKATLPVTGRLAGLTDAEIVPLFSVYDRKTHRLTVYIQMPSDACQQADAQAAARAINIITEAFVAPHPEQYVWVLKLLKTRTPGEVDPYDD
ncbi:TPA: lauroyl-Kdo(2)-lipid IV(A) myristoyltransferase [Escherichia coli]